MNSRFYTVAFVALGIGLFALGLVANVLLDPEGILGTGVTAEAVSRNARYDKFTDYAKAADQYDGLMFGSSRGPAIPRDELSRRLNAHFADFTAVGGTMTDYEPALRYVVSSKLRKGQRLKAVFLLLDLDNFGVAGPTGRTLQTMLPPEMTGESPVRFYWRYLSAFQFDAWRNAIRSAWRDGFARAWGLDIAWSTAAFAAEATTLPQSGRPKVDLVARPWTPQEYAHQLELLRSFVELCRQHQVRLVVAASPLHRRTAMLYGAEELARRREGIAAITPIWDFGSPDWLSDRPDLWGDDSHFFTPVGRMMLDAIFDPDGGSTPAGFGRLYGN
jgi:hypothetical protein